MFMNSNLQSLFVNETNKIKKMAEALDSNGVGIKDNAEFKALNCTSWDICQADICQFMTYLDMTQGKINPDTAQLINYLYDCDFSENELMCNPFYVKRSNPRFFCHTVKIDKMAETDFSKMVKEIYMHIAGIVVSVNNNDDKIVEVVAEFLVAMDTFRKKELG